MGDRLRDFKADFFKALAHPLRISILDTLRDGEMTVNAISEQIEVAQANASQQLAVLRGKNIVRARKAGASVYYSIVDPEIFALLDVARVIFNNHLVGVKSLLEEIDREAPAPAAAKRASRTSRS